MTATRMQQETYVRRATVLRVVDGDTLDLNIDLGWDTWLRERVRILGVDTPEVRGDEREAGLYVSAEVRGHLLREDVTVQSVHYAHDRYGRTVACVWSETLPQGLGPWLLEQKLAWPTDGGGKIVGPRDLALLTGLPERLRGNE